MCPLPKEQKQLLLEVARSAIIDAVHDAASAAVSSSDVDSFLAPGAFVTLHRRRRLRGCIGQIAAPQPIVPLIAYCARAAALEDPRFRPVEPHEIPEIDIELSILSALEPVRPERIEIGRHGLMVTRGSRRGVLLPQVPLQFRWDAARFLSETCSKAGLDQTAWRDADTRIEAFTAEVFSESELLLPAVAVVDSPAGGPGYSSST